MKKILSLILMLCLIFPAAAIAANPYAKPTEENLNRDVRKAISNLAGLDVVRKPFTRWNESDYITRRDVFKMAYVVKMDTRRYHRYPADINDAESVKKTDEDISGLIKILKEKYHVQTEYADIVPGTDDYYLVYNLLAAQLIAGQPDGDVYNANLDAYATYEEALTVLVRLFYYQKHMPSEAHYSLTDYTGPHKAFDIATDMNLINSKNPYDVYTQHISLEQLDQPITAYRFMHLLDRALYLPVIGLQDYAVPLTERYVELIRDLKKEDKEWQNIVD